MVVEITEKEFEEKTKDGKVLVDCYAPWCGPCKMLSPIIDEVAKEVSDYSFCKLNIDEAQEVADTYGIMSIPTILLFENGDLKNKMVGFQTAEDLKRILGA